MTACLLLGYAEAIEALENTVHHHFWERFCTGEKGKERKLAYNRPGCGLVALSCPQAQLSTQKEALVGFPSPHSVD